MRVFADTSALYAILDRDDDNHEVAATTWQRLVGSDATVVGSNYVMVETSALVQNRLGMDAVRALVESIEPVLWLEWVTREDHDAAQAAVLTANRRGLSLVDCASFVVMRRLALRRAFAFDNHFREQGFEQVGPTP